MEVVVQEEDQLGGLEKRVSGGPNTNCLSEQGSHGFFLNLCLLLHKTDVKADPLRSCDED